MAVYLSPLFGVAGQIFDNNGTPLAGGKIFSYLAGTTTPTTTYTTSAGNVAHTNPIILDSAGRIPGGEIWLTEQVIYKFSIQDANNILIGTYDNISGINAVNASQIPFTGFKGQSGNVQNLGSSAGSNWIGYQPSGTNAVPVSIQDKLREFISIKDFGAVGDGVTNDSAALLAAAKYASPLKATVVIPAGTYLFKSGINGVNDNVSWLRLSMYGAIFRFDITAGGFDFLVDINELEIEGGQIGASGYDLGGSMTIRYNTGSHQSLKLNAVDFQSSANGIQARCIFATAGIDISDVEIRACNFRNFGRGAIEIRSNTIAQQEARYWVEDCYFKNLGNASSLGCVAINFGNDTNVVKNVTIKNNVIERVSVTGGNPCEVHAILVYGESCVIDGNHINDIRNDSGDDAEGIYVKCSYSRIVNNYVRNGGNSHDGCVTIKGFGIDGGLQFSDYCVVSNNVIEFDSNLIDCPGIGVQRSFVIVSNNVLKDLRTTRNSKTYSIAMAIGTAGYANNVTICDNIVDGFVSFIGDATTPAFLTNNVTIDGNIVTNLDGGYGIFYRNDARISNRSMIFSSADNSITFDQTVAFPGTWDYPTYQPGDQIRIINSTSNDGVYTIATYVNETKITVVEPVVNQTSDPADAYLVDSEPIRITNNNIRSIAGLFFIRNSTNQCKASLVYIANNTISGFDRVYRLDQSGGIGVCHIANNDYQAIGTALKFSSIQADTLIEADRSPGLSAPATTLGSVIRRVPIYDSVTNALVGYMPIYDNIT
jgi:hypothetical protein